jgi:hypothetical protein
MWSRPLTSIEWVRSVRLNDATRPGTQPQLVLGVGLGRGRCSFADGVVTLDAGTGQAVSRHRLPPPVPGGVSPAPDLKISGANGEYHVGRETDIARVQALQVGTGRVLWASSLPDQYGQAFQAFTYAAGLATPDVVYVAYAVESRPYTCGSD